MFFRENPGHKTRQPRNSTIAGTQGFRGEKHLGNHVILIFWTNFIGTSLVSKWRKTARKHIRLVVASHNTPTNRMDRTSLMKHLHNQCKSLNV
jgi:hypothetical protein